MSSTKRVAAHRVLRSPALGLMLAANAVLALATVIGGVALWPYDAKIEQPPSLVRPTTHEAEVVAVALADCRVPGRENCRRVSAVLQSGPERDKRVTFTVGDTPDQTGIDVGDRIRVAKSPLPPDAVVGGVRADQYSFADFERRTPLLWLALGFVAIVLFAGRWKGFRALLGLVASLAIVLFFVVPAILDGQPATEVALVGALGVMFATIPLAHGLGPKSIAAMLGTGLSLLLTLALANTATAFTNLTGFASEESIFLRANVEDLSLRGLLLAGMVIGALGVLDDLTVTQSSTVLALRRANPNLSFTGLFRGALAVGHDHIAATVNTLFLAYVGAALPLLLLFNLGDAAFGDVVNSEAVAQEIVAMLVGSIGLIAAVPITTSLAAVLATHVQPSELGADLHAH